jgi:hypothetical protein
MADPTPADRNRVQPGPTVPLTEPDSVGKTRLAQDIAADSACAFPNGLVSLPPIAGSAITAPFLQELSGPQMLLRGVDPGAWQ